MAKRRVGRKCLEQRQITPQSIERANCGLRIRHPHVHMHPANRSHHSIAEQEANALVALLVGDQRVALGCGGMGPRREIPAPVFATAWRR